MAISSMGLRALKYYCKADTLYDVHSPFIYDLLDHILDKDKNYYDFDLLEGRRQGLLASSEQVQFTELGAGSRRLKSNLRKISDIAKTSLSPPKQCQSLYRLVNYYKPKIILELGTSLGLSSAYLALAHHKSQVTSLEGDPNVANFARQLIAELNIKNVEIRTGDFKKTLAPVLNQLQSIDLGFLDGNHTYEATCSYFNQILPYVHNDTVLILDDVHWTKDMELAWNEIRHHDRVTASVDFFYFGMIWFRPQFTSKVHHDLVSTHLKPWCVLKGI